MHNEEAAARRFPGTANTANQRLDGRTNEPEPSLMEPERKNVLNGNNEDFLQFGPKVEPAAVEKPDGNETASISIPPAWSQVPETRFAIHGAKIELGLGGGPEPGRGLIITRGFLKKKL